MFWLGIQSKQLGKGCLLIFCYSYSLLVLILIFSTSSNFLSSIYEQSVYELDTCTVNQYLITLVCTPVIWSHQAGVHIPLSGHTRPVHVLTGVDSNWVVLELNICCRVIPQNDKHFKFCFKFMIFNRTMLLSFIGEVVIKVNFPFCSVSFPQKFWFVFPSVCSKE